MKIDGALHRPACARGVRHLARSGRSFSGIPARAAGGGGTLLEATRELRAEDSSSNLKFESCPAFPINHGSFPGLPRRWLLPSLHDT